MRKTYVLDTNVLLHDPEALYNFQDNDLVIPLVVIEEIDTQKRRQDEVGRNARQTSAQLDALRGQGHLWEGISNAAGGSVRIELSRGSEGDLPPDLDRHKVDNQLLSLCLRLKKERPRRRVILVSKDINMRVKADALDIEAADYETDKVDLPSNEMYSGLRVFECDRTAVEAFNRDGAFPPPEPDSPAENGWKGGCLHSNEFVHFKAGEPGSGTPSALGRYDAEAGMIVPLLAIKKDIWGLMPKNMGQRLALELLLDERIPMVTLTGRAGTGKTLLALAAGLSRTLDDRRYRRMLVTRPVIPMGKDVGYLPGDKDEKLRPWMQPVYDNIELLMGGAGSEREQTVDELVNHFKAKGMLEVEALTYIRGRSIPQQFILVDEAQNLTPHETKTIISRAGEGTKVVLTGDPFQIDHPYLDERSNGLSFVVERFKNQPLAGHVTLTRGERSRLAELAASIL